MIIDISEKEYRKIKLNSSSSLKDFSLDRRKYYKKYILEERIKEQENKAANMGRLVETLLMEPERFDELFFMSTCVKIPGGMLGDFIYALSELVADHDLTEEELDDDTFKELALQAHNTAGFKIKFETVLSKLDEPENQLYYKECLMVNHLNMTMVTSQDIENAERIVFELKNNPNTAHIVGLESNEDFTVLNQLKIRDYIIDGIKLKSMLDKVIINHKTKRVHIYDLKCTWSVEGFYKEYYLFRRAYIQGFLYYHAVKYLTALPDSGMYGYEVLPPNFLVCDSINYYQPLIYQLSNEDLHEAYLGFEYKDNVYPGVKTIIEELKWALDEGIWNISKTNFDKRGVLNIKD